MFLLIENLPILLPEMLDELIAWKPVTYREYFQRVASAGLRPRDCDLRRRSTRTSATSSRPSSRASTAIALASVQVIANHRSPAGEIDPEQVSEFCENSARAMRSALNRAADLVNNGRGEVVETPQEMVERILSVAEAAHGSPDLAAAPVAAEAPPAAEPPAELPVEAAAETPPPMPEPLPPTIEPPMPEPVMLAPQTSPPAAKTVAPPPAPKTSADDDAPAKGEPRAKGQNSAVPSAGDESYFTVFAGGECFGLSVLHAQTIFRIGSITPIPMGPVDIVGLVNLRGRIVTAVSLRRRLGIAGREPAERAGHRHRAQGREFRSDGR